jgi:polysaccharide export outer membrane protein
MNKVLGDNLSKRIAKWSPIFSAALLYCGLFGGSALLAAGQNTETKDNADYRLGIGDVVRVTVVKQPLLSVDAVRIGNDGMIHLPMLEGNIQAACLTETELSNAIGERYKKYLLNPQIYIAIKEFNANPVSFLGAVVTPGKLQLQRSMRLLELLAFVNGPAPNAGKNIQIIRTRNQNRCGVDQAKEAEQNEQDVISLPLADVLKGDEKFNPLVQSGDIIRIAEAKIEQAFIVGNVKSAAIINLKEPVTLSKAIAMAGGVAPGGNIEKIKVSRQSADSLSKNEITVNLKEINNRVRDDLWLEPNDIVEVPGPNGTKKLLRDILRIGVPISTAITGVPILIP